MTHSFWFARLAHVSWCGVSAFLFSIAWITPVLAAGGGDGDGFDGDETIWPLLVLGGMILIGAIIFFVRRSRLRAASSARNEE